MAVTARNTYLFAVLPAEVMLPEEVAAGYMTLAGMIPADRTNFTTSLQNHQLCESTCTAQRRCVGFTTDLSPTNCWLCIRPKTPIPMRAAFISVY